jgi:murein DD-endopeptidase MepM/ murein hydrolase activator NlpD
MKTLFHPLAKQSYRLGFTHGQRYPASFGSLAGVQHRGVDYILPVGRAVYAPEDGLIERLYTGQGGNTIVLVSRRYQHRLMHLSSYQCKAGQLVKMGDRIGTTGNTGLSTTPHLHWDMWDKYNGAFNALVFRGFVDPHSFNIIKEIPMNMTQVKKDVAQAFYDVFGTCPRTQYLGFESRKVERKEITIDQLRGIWNNNRREYQKHIYNAVQYVRNYPDLMAAFIGSGKIDIEVEKKYNTICNHYIQYGIKEGRTDQVL